MNVKYILGHIIHIREKPSIQTTPNRNPTTHSSNMSSLEGKVIALTGGASGIGLATAKLLAQRGAILSLADINGKQLEAAAKSLERRMGPKSFSPWLTSRNYRR